MVRNNNLTSIEAIKNLTKLKFLDLMNNKIKSLNDLKMLSSLSNLFVRNNLIESFSGLENLTLNKLEMKRNNIRNLFGFDKIKNLKYLNLLNNQLNSNENYSSLNLSSGLSIIYDYQELIKNNISVFTGLRLQELDLRNQRINFLKSFSITGEFESLVLSYNLIKEFQFKAFFNLPQLKKLYLFNNLISSLDFKEAFYQATSSLVTLDLEFNRISNIVENFFLNLQNFKI